MAPIRVLSVFLLAGWAANAQSARQLARQAKKAEREGDVVRAYLKYAHAAAADPSNPLHWARSLALRTQAALQAKVMPPLGPADLDPEADAAPVSTEELAEARRPQAPFEMKGAPGRQSFDLRADSKELWEKVSKALNLDVIFDGDYQPATNVRFRIQEATYQEALYALQAATGAFVVPISEKLMMVAKDSPQKRQEIEPTMTVTIPIPHPVTVQEAQELARSVQQAFELQRFSVDNQRRLILVRDRVSKVKPALALVEQLLYHRPEVSVEIELLETSESFSSSYGVNLQSKTGLAWLSSIWRSTPVFPAGFTNFLTFGAGRSAFGFGVTSAEMFASMSRSGVRNLMRAEVRSLDGLPATFHLGDRYPIISAGYFGGPQGGSGQVYTPPPTFNFEDLGMVIKITPRVHGAEEVTLDIEAEFKVLTGEALNGIPVIANRKIASKARLQFGEWAVVSGLLRSTEARSLTGPAGLSTLPGIGHLVRQNDRSRETGETLLLFKPKLLSLPASEDGATRAIWMGAEQRLRVPL